MSGDMEHLHERLFRGMLLEADIAGREERGELPRFGESLKQFHLLGRFADSFPGVLAERAAEMAYVYGLIYCFENAVRDLVARRLEERRGGNWWDSVPEKVKAYVDARRKEAEENKWHEVSVDANIDYALFGHLASIMSTLWQDFDDLFPSQQWIVQRLEELERSRNVVMHGNFLPQSEVERLERYLTDWLKQVP